MEGHAKKCAEIACELANKTAQQLYKVSTPCLDDHQIKEEEMETFCSQIVLNRLNLGTCVLTRRECKPNNSLVDEYRKVFASRIFAGAIEKLPDSGKGNGEVTVWSYDMAGTRTTKMR